MPWLNELDCNSALPPPPPQWLPSLLYRVEGHFSLLLLYAPSRDEELSLGYVNAPTNVNRWRGVGGGNLAICNLGLLTILVDFLT